MIVAQILLQVNSSILETSAQFDCKKIVIHQKVLRINNAIVTICGKFLILSNSNKKFDLEGDFLEMMANFIFNAYLSIS